MQYAKARGFLILAFVSMAVALTANDAQAQYGTPSTAIGLARNLSADPNAPRRDSAVTRVQDPSTVSAPPTIPGSGAVEPVPAAPSLPKSEAVEEGLSKPRADKSGGGAEAPAAEVAAEPEKPDTNLLMKFLGKSDSKYKVYGWIQNSFTGNANGPGRTKQNFGVNPNSQANRWMGNQYYLIFEKTLEQDDTINFGYRVDNLFGHDWVFNHEHGFLDTQNRPGRFAGYDMAQAYAEVHLPVLTKGGMDIKGGRFYTLAGYEVVPATGRPLLSVPYMFNYGQPFTHFGALSTLHVTDKLNVYNGIINGWDRWINNTYKWGYIGGFSWTFNNDKTSLATTIIAGPQQFPHYLPINTAIQPTGTPVVPPQFAGRRNYSYAANDRTIVTTVLSHKWNDKLTQVLETDQAFEANVPFLGPNGTRHNAEWQSFGNWFLYSFTDKFTGVWRSEVFRDNNGVRTGFADNYYEFTVGGIYKPKPWLWVRPEARYDWAQFNRPFKDGTRGSQFTLGFDVIVLF